VSRAATTHPTKGRHTPVESKWAGTAVRLWALEIVLALGACGPGKEAVERCAQALQAARAPGVRRDGRIVSYSSQTLGPGRYVLTGEFSFLQSMPPAEAPRVDEKGRIIDSGPWTNTRFQTPFVCTLHCQGSTCVVEEARDLLGPQPQPQPTIVPSRARPFRLRPGIGTRVRAGGGRYGLTQRLQATAARSWLQAGPPRLSRGVRRTREGADVPVSKAAGRRFRPPIAA
jgi:hypothetical protein